MDGFDVKPGYQDSLDEIVLKSSSKMTVIEREFFPEIRFDFKGLEEVNGLPNNSDVGRM